MLQNAIPHDVSRYIYCIHLGSIYCVINVHIIIKMKSYINMILLLKYDILSYQSFYIDVPIIVLLCRSNDALGSALVKISDG